MGPRAISSIFSSLLPGAAAAAAGGAVDADDELAAAVVAAALALLPLLPLLLLLLLLLDFPFEPRFCFPVALASLLVPNAAASSSIFRAMTSVLLLLWECCAP
jgi:hypothetical protein